MPEQQGAAIRAADLFGASAAELIFERGPVGAVEGLIERQAAERRALVDLLERLKEGEGIARPGDKLPVLYEREQIRDALEVMLGELAPDDEPDVTMALTTVFRDLTARLVKLEDKVSDSILSGEVIERLQAVEARFAE